VAIDRIRRRERVRLGANREAPTRVPFACDPL
jgi:hypothetical protein